MSTSKKDFDLYQLLIVLHEEWSANGEQFNSMEADTMFRARFTDWGDGPKQGFEKLLTEYDLKK